MLHHVAPICTMLHHVAPSCTILHHLATSCTILHHVAPCCTILHRSAPCFTILHHERLLRHFWDTFETLLRQSSLDGVLIDVWTSVHCLKQDLGHQAGLNKSCSRRLGRNNSNRHMHWWLRLYKKKSFYTNLNDLEPCIGVVGVAPYSLALIIIALIIVSIFITRLKSLQRWDITDDR